MDDVDAAQQPHCTTCGTVFRDIPGGYQCVTCRTVNTVPQVGLPPEFQGPSIHGG